MEDLQPLDFQSDSRSDLIHPKAPDSFLPPIGQLPVLGGLVLLAAFIGVVALSNILKYKVTVKAPAIVRPVGELRVVQSSTDGIIKNIAVVGNQSIHQGDIIATIDDSRLQNQKNQLEGAIQQTEQELLHLGSQLAALNRQVEAESEQTTQTIASANADLNLNQRTYQDKVITTSAEVREAEANVALAQEELTRYQQLSGTGVIPQLQVKEKEFALKTAQARLEGMKAALNPSTASVGMAQERINQERTKGLATLATLSGEQGQLLQKQAELKTQLDRDRKELHQVETDLQNTIIRAPVSGIIQELTLRNQAQVVHMGDKIAQISPKDAPLRIKAMVAAQDIGNVKMDQPVFMRVSACPYPDYGVLLGQVTMIAPDAMTSSVEVSDASSGQSRSAMGVGYEITVQPGDLALKANGQECRIQSGMEGSVEIVSREETVLQFLLRRARLLVHY